MAPLRMGNHHYRPDAADSAGAASIAHPNDLGGSIGGACFTSFIPAFDFDPVWSGPGGYVSNVAKEAIHDHGKITHKHGKPEANV